MVPPPAATQVIHYHGFPISPTTAAVEAIGGGHAFVSFASTSMIGVVMEYAQSFAIDNGAFSAWSVGRPVLDWKPFYAWVDEIRSHPGFDWAVIPDVVDGDERANDELLAQWPFPRWTGAPVWHMHESVKRLARLCDEWPRVCLGSSGEYRTVGTDLWWRRMGEAMNAVTDVHGLPSAKLHGLRMLNPKVFTRLPLSSADSTNIGRNIGIDSKWKGTYSPPTKEARARVMRERIEAFNSASHWTRVEEEDLF